MTTDPLILVDADACPVKDEIYKVALRHAVAVEIIANSYMRVPDHPLISRHIVSADFDAADDFIAEKSGPMKIIITADILLAERVLKKGAYVLAPNGKPFTENSIGAALAVRAIMADLRGGGEQIGGPPPFSKQDRSRFLSSIAEILVRLKACPTEATLPKRP